MTAAAPALAPADPLGGADAPALPGLAPGVELIGRYQGSGFKQSPWLVRRADGQVIQLPHLLYQVAEALVDHRDPEAIAARMTAAIGRGMTAEQVVYVVEEKLRPLSLLAGEDEPAKKANPLLALTFRAKVVSPRITQAITGAFAWLFIPWIVVAVLVGLVAVDVWLLTQGGLFAGVEAALAEPLFILLVFGLIIASAGFHELGHAAACRYGGARPGAMGVGLYIAWPVFYTDITDAYRLDRVGKLRVDLGGVYFNTIVILATAAAYAATGWAPLLLVILVQHLEIARQLLPVVRLDGYYILADLTGVPDLFARIKPLLASLVPGRPIHPQAAELKPWVRVVVTGWVLVTIPAIVGLYVFLIGYVPVLMERAATLFGMHVADMRAAFAAGDTAQGLVGVLRVVTLAVPAAAVTLTLGRTAKRLGQGAWRLTRRRLGSEAASSWTSPYVRGVSYAWWLTGDRAAAEDLTRSGLEALDESEAVALIATVRDRAPAVLSPAAEIALLHDGFDMELSDAAALAAVPAEQAAQLLAAGRLNALEEAPAVEHPDAAGALAIADPAGVIHALSCPSCTALRPRLEEGRQVTAHLARRPVMQQGRPEGVPG
jgi:putative peptide zinc metalloprotease protein